MPLSSISTCFQSLFLWCCDNGNCLTNHVHQLQGWWTWYWESQISYQALYELTKHCHFTCVIEYSSDWKLCWFTHMWVCGIIASKPTGPTTVTRIWIVPWLTVSCWGWQLSTLVNVRFKCACPQPFYLLIISETTDLGAPHLVAIHNKFLTTSLYQRDRRTAAGGLCCPGPGPYY
jgi:hypothetical protein